MGGILGETLSNYSSLVKRGCCALDEFLGVVAGVAIIPCLASRKATCY